MKDQLEDYIARYGLDDLISDISDVVADMEKAVGRGFPEDIMRIAIGKLTQARSVLTMTRMKAAEAMKRGVVFDHNPARRKGGAG